ncbi:hypothetical protein DIPPA_26331 [Diplonema papillatum]|nr:hypothetical protein DIPPA_26331 [Diplonema papillatum]
MKLGVEQSAGIWSPQAEDLDGPGESEAAPRHSSVGERHRGRSGQGLGQDRTTDGGELRRPPPDGAVHRAARARSEPQEAVRDLEEKTAQTFGQASQKVAEHDVRLQMMEAGNAEMKQMLSSLMGMVTGLSAGGMPQRSRALGFADLGEGARWPGIFPGPTRMDVLRVFETRFERVLCTGARPGAREQAKGQLANLETGFDYFSDPERPVGGSFGDVHMVAVVDRAIARLVALQFGEETGVKGGHAGMFEKALEEQDLPGPLAEAWKEAERQRARSKGTKSQSSGQWNRSTYVQPVTGGKIGYPTVQGYGVARGQRAVFGVRETTGVNAAVSERLRLDGRHSGLAGIQARERAYGRLMEALAELGLGAKGNSIVTRQQREYLEAVQARAVAATTMVRWAQRLEKLVGVKKRFPGAGLHDWVGVYLAESAGVRPSTQRDYALCLRSVFQRWAPHVRLGVLEAHVAGLTALGADVPTRQAVPVEPKHWELLRRALSPEQMAFCCVQHLLGLRWEGVSRLEDLKVVQREADVLKLTLVQRESKTENRPTRRNVCLRGVFRQDVERFVAGRSSIDGPVFNVAYKPLLARLKQVGVTTHAFKRGYAHAIDDMGVDDARLQRLTGHRQFKNVETYLGLERAAERRERGAGVEDVVRRLQDVQ